MLQMKYMENKEHVGDLVVICVETESHSYQTCFSAINTPSIKATVHVKLLLKLLKWDE